MNAFLIQFGRIWTPSPWRLELGRRGRMGQCYGNAFLLAQRNPSLLYVEGVAGEYRLDHAWCIDAAGLVLDPTWRETEGQYFGVPLLLPVVARWILDVNGFGPFLDLATSEAIDHRAQGRDR